VFPKVAAIGAEAVQLFISAPQQWRLPALKDEQVAAFQERLGEADIPAFFHGVYLMNFASQDPAILEKSVASLTSYLNWAETLGVVGTIFHVGSHLGAGFEPMLEQMCRLLRECLEGAPNERLLILENSAGQGNCCGKDFAELGALVRGLDNDPRVAVCIDTCHAFAMGYDITTREGCEIAFEELDREVGVQRLVAVHANDSKMPLGGVRDRHENIGDGHIGYAGFEAFMAHPAVRDVPFLLEVPGLDNKGPDAENVARLKKIRDGLGLAVS
jgi:deoxyribonuclease-4